MDVCYINDTGDYKFDHDISPDSFFNVQSCIIQSSTDILHTELESSMLMHS